MSSSTSTNKRAALEDGIRKRIEASPQSAPNAMPEKPSPSAGTGFTRLELDQQKAKRKAWLQSEEAERNAIRISSAQTQDKRGRMALAMTLIVWACIILSIFAFVWTAMSRGHSAHVQRQEAARHTKANFFRNK